MREEKKDLYDRSFEHDNCGIGAIIDIYGRKSHKVVSDALSIVENLEHRAGKDAAGETGDGVGILTQIPHKLYVSKCEELGIKLRGEREYGVGMFFMPDNELKCAQAKKMFEVIVGKEGLDFLGWREVPTVPAVLGSKAIACMPVILQAFIDRKNGFQTLTSTGSCM